MWVSWGVQNAIPVFHALQEFFGSVLILAVVKHIGYVLADDLAEIIFSIRVGSDKPCELAGCFFVITNEPRVYARLTR